MAVRPAQMVMNLRTEGCSVRATWVLPNNGGSRITNLLFQVRHSATIADKDEGSVEKWDNINLPRECQFATSTSCLIPFSTLLALPYALPINAVVYARVRASNSVGHSDYSE